MTGVTSARDRSHSGTPGNLRDRLPCEAVGSILFVVLVPQPLLDVRFSRSIANGYKKFDKTAQPGMAVPLFWAARYGPMSE